MREGWDALPTAEGAGDMVDRLVAEWNVAMPGQDVRCLHIVSRMLRLIRIFEQDRAQVLSAVGLEAWSFDMLAVIRRQTGTATTVGDLTAATLVTSGTMTARLKSLERRGWVTRSPSPTDRRNVLVVLTIPGRQLFDEVFAKVLECQRRLVAQLDAKDGDALAGVLRRLLLGLEGPADEKDPAE